MNLNEKALEAGIDAALIRMNTEGVSFAGFNHDNIKSVFSAFASAYLSALVPADVSALVERLNVRWEATDEPTTRKINRFIRERKEAASLIQSQAARIAELERERETWFRAAKDALATGTVVPMTEPTRKTSQRDDWHYDSDGYCDNPGRGY
jgi:aromatic ring hydroxylase